MTFLRSTLLAAVAAFAFAPEAPAGDDLPVKVDFVFRFNVRVGPSVMVPADLPPWHAWFPYDPNMNLHAPQTSPYPHWPSPFPPAGAAARPGAMTYQPAAPVQRVGYPSSVPSYWYGR